MAWLMGEYVLKGVAGIWLGYSIGIIIAAIWLMQRFLHLTRDLADQKLNQS